MSCETALRSIHWEMSERELESPREVKISSEKPILSKEFGQMDFGLCVLIIERDFRGKCSAISYVMNLCDIGSMQRDLWEDERLLFLTTI